MRPSQLGGYFGFRDFSAAANMEQCGKPCGCEGFHLLRSFRLCHLPIDTA